MYTPSKSAVGETSRWLISVGIFFVVALLALLGYTLTVQSHFSLTLDMASSAASTAQLFYSPRGNYSEQNSRIATVRGDSLKDFQRLTFDLPAITIRSMRFDPLTRSGTFIIRNVTIRSGNEVLLRIPASDIIVFKQISRREQHGADVLFSTDAQAPDPGVLILLHEAVRLRHFDRLERIRLFLIGLAILLASSALLVVYRWQVRAYGTSFLAYVKRVHVCFGRFGARLSNPDWLVLDSNAIWFYVLCFVVFSAAACADLNGSSAEILSRDYHHGPNTGLLLGTPKGSRADEWSYQTPAMLNQMFRRDWFAAAQTEPGGHFIGLTANIPLLHVSTLFRPQLWSFFILPADYAYAVNWQFKGLLLIAGVFTWLLLFTRSTLWAITGSLWFFFSPQTQWDYSWASALPEMIGLTCLGMVLACYLTIGRNRLALVLAGIGLAACAIDVALCAYLPHLIPLAWVSIFFFAAWCCAKRRAIAERGDLRFRIFAIVLAASIVAIVGFITYRDLHVAIAAVANTVYPGRRVESSGQAALYLLLSHFMQWTETEGRMPAVLGNMCEGSGYLWLAPITLACVGRLRLSRWQKFALASLWLTFCFFLAWFFLPVPAVLGAVLGLNRTGTTRIMPALGLVNVGIVVLCGPCLQRSPARLRSLGWLTPVIAFGILYVAFRYADLKLQSYFDMWEVAIFALFITLLVVLYLWRRKWAFAIALIVPQAIAFGAVNPLQRGLAVYTESDLRRFVRDRPELLNGKWLVFSDSVVASGFVASTGADVYTGLHYIPDIDHFPLFAANHLDLDILNRDGYLGAHLRSPQQKMFVRLRNIGFVEWNVSPADPILKQLGIRYVAFDFRPPAVWSRYMTPLSTTAVDEFWLYKLR